MEPEEILSSTERLIAGIRARGYPMCLQYAGVSIAYTSEDAAVAEWVGQFLAGCFMPSGATAAEDFAICAARCAPPSWRRR